MIRVYGIKTCDTVRKALKYLKEKGVDFVFVDFKKSPVGCEKIDEWLSKAPIETLFNKRGTKYRMLNPKFALANASSVSIIGGMGDRSECSTHPPGAPAFRLGLRGFATLRPLRVRSYKQQAVVVCLTLLPPADQASAHLTHFLLHGLG